MATRKINRSIHLTQPQPELPELLPVRARAYCTLGEMNTGLEQAIQSLETLVKIKYFSSDSLNHTLNLLSQTRAQANRQFIAVLAERETTNAGHFERLCLQREKAGS
jgi:hypothetical protein